MPKSAVADDGAVRGLPIVGAAPTGDRDVSLRIRSLGLLFLAGATIGLISVLLPHPAKADTTGLYWNIAFAFLGGFVLLLCPQRLTARLLHPAVIAGTLLITRAVFISGDPVSFYSVWFIWVALYAFYFFDRAVACAYGALCAALYALTLTHSPPTSPVARWLTTVATLVVAGGFIDTLVRRSRQEAAHAATNAEKMAKVADVAVELASISDGKVARAALCDAAVELTGAASAVLWEPTAPGGELRVSATHAATISGLAIPAGEASAGVARAFGTGAVISTSSLESSGISAPEFSAGNGSPLACMWQPVIHDQQTIAVLALAWRSSSALEGESLLPLCELIAAEIKVTLERITLLRRLEGIARTDELTGLPNRRAWEEALHRELRRAARSGKPLCIAMLDLDHFKRYNDALGHLAGDELLKEVAAAWTSELRGGDFLVRYGGEEFAVALPSCAPDEALPIVERMRQAIPGGQSCSAGIAVWREPEAAAELVGRADRALYDAKRGGRNRTIVAEGLESPATVA